MPGVKRIVRGRASEFLEPTEHHSGLSVEPGDRRLVHLGEERLQRHEEACRARQLGPVLVDHATRGCLERRCQCAGGLCQVLVGDRLEFGSPVGAEEAHERQESTGLSLAQVSGGVEKTGRVVAPLAKGGRRGVLFGEGEVDARGRASYLEEPLGAAAGAADGLT